jgi:uncharacterized RDD family membrane protein YckC
LAVRRATPEVPRVRADVRGQSFDLEFEPNIPAPPTPVARRHAERHSADRADQILMEPPAAEQDGAQRPTPDASLGARMVAGLLDLGILCVVDLLVIYFTMAIAGVGALELGLLPKAPLLAFLVLQNGGYLVGFTAGGQTLGQMALGLRVVTAADAGPLSVARALTRTVVWSLLTLPAGLGLLTAVFASDHRGLHDRLAGTRVVRASV